MKTTIALLSIALLASCASKTDFIDNQAQECAHPIEVRAGFENMPGIRRERADDRLTLIVEVANNGNDDFTVKTIRAEQVADDRAFYRLNNGFGSFNQVVAEGKDHVFRLQMDGRVLGGPIDQERGYQLQLELAVTVNLEDGRSFRCVFGVQPPI